MDLDELGESSSHTHTSKSEKWILNLKNNRMLAGDRSYKGSNSRVSSWLKPQLSGMISASPVAILGQIQIVLARILK